MHQNVLALYPTRGGHTPELMALDSGYVSIGSEAKPNKETICTDGFTGNKYNGCMCKNVEWIEDGPYDKHTK